ncbi:MAG: hypothetical protein LBD47_12540 [Treponema sp.]|jgi:hypothetical protein|nr:hypothetical protein [Treponema sp.]
MGIIKEMRITQKIILCLLPFLASALYAETAVEFRDFPWGTSMAEFTGKMGKPVSREEINDLVSLAYENIEVSGYTTYMVVYFSKTGLEGGTYYFLTKDLDELMKCYQELQKELLERYGPTSLRDGIIRERRPYETSWNLESGYVYLKVNTRLGEPVTLWYSSPALTKKLFGG